MLSQMTMLSIYASVVVKQLAIIHVCSRNIAQIFKATLLHSKAERLAIFVHAFIAGALPIFFSTYTNVYSLDVVSVNPNMHDCTNE